MPGMFLKQKSKSEKNKSLQIAKTKFFANRLTESFAKIKEIFAGIKPNKKSDKKSESKETITEKTLALDTSSFLEIKVSSLPLLSPLKF